MALYHLSVKTVSRGAGRSAVACAAYRTAELLRDERTGQVHDYERKRGVEARLLLVPDGAGGVAAMEGEGWTAERERLWNAAEVAEKRKDARVAREYELALPHELDAAGRRRLVSVFAAELADRYGVAVDAAIHAPGREGDRRNWHAHVLTTTRRVTPEGMGEKAGIELSDTARAKQGLGPGAAEIEGWREVWGALVNRELERALVPERVDHRSYARQGRAEEATQHLGPAASGMERKAARLARQRAQQDQDQERERDRAADMPEPGAAAPEPRREAPGMGRERPQGATGAAPVPAEAPRPAPVPRTAQDGPERAREAAGRPLAPREADDHHPPPRRAAVGPSAGVYGAGDEPATRIGRRNAEIQERNRVREAARAALEAARRVVERLEEARRRVVGLVRGVGAQVVAEREERAREAERLRRELARQERELRAEQERRLEQDRLVQERARRLAEEQRAELARRTTQEQRDLARQRQRTLTPEQEAEQRARAAEQARRQAQEREVVRYRGPSLGM